MHGLVYLNNRYHDPTLGTFISVDPLVVKTGEPYIYGATNPISSSDPSGLEVCYTSGSKKGQCYEAADGEQGAMTSAEVAATVKIMTPTAVNPDGSVQKSTNVRFTRFGDVSSEEIVNVVRAVASNPMLHGDALTSQLIQDLGTESGFGFEGFAGTVQLLLVAGSFTPCSAICATGAATISTWQAADTCSSQGWGTSCAVSSSAAALSWAGPVSAGVSKVSKSVEVAAAARTASWSARTTPFATSTEFGVKGFWATPAYFASATAHTAQRVQMGADATNRIASAFDAVWTVSSSAW